MRSVHGGREMLNLSGHHSAAAIVAEIEDTSDWAYGKSRDGQALDQYNSFPNYTFAITDCSGIINLDIDVDSDNGVENSLHKIDTMLEILTKFRKGIQEESVRFASRQSRIKRDTRFPK